MSDSFIFGDIIQVVEVGIKLICNIILNGILLKQKQT
jgi:hypothetical protein